MIREKYDSFVASFRGAWIEIKDVTEGVKKAVVASFRGAWIEIPNYDIDKITFVLSHPSGVRGLKSFDHRCAVLPAGVASFRGAWIEINLSISFSLSSSVASFRDAFLMKSYI